MHFFYENCASVLLFDDEDANAKFKRGEVNAIIENVVKIDT
jgi:hypothetical protein